MKSDKYIDPDAPRIFISSTLEDEEIDDLMEIEYITKDINDLIQERMKLHLSYLLQD